jgi:hypothetical protein
MVRISVLAQRSSGEGRATKPPVGTGACGLGGASTTLIAGLPYSSAPFGLARGDVAVLNK